MNNESTSDITESTEAARTLAMERFMEQVVKYRNLYHNKLQNELRQRRHDQHQISHCNTILLASRRLIEMHQRGEHNLRAFEASRQTLLRSIEEFEDHARRNLPLIKVIPSSPRRNKDLEQGDELQYLPGMQKGDVFL